MIFPGALRQREAEVTREVSVLRVSRPGLAQSEVTLSEQLSATARRDESQHIGDQDLELLAQRRPQVDKPRLTAFVPKTRDGQSSPDGHGPPLQVLVTKREDAGVQGPTVEELLFIPARLAGAGRGGERR